MSLEECGTCLYFQWITDQGDGWCRAHPPVNIYGATQDAFGKDINGSFPGVTRYDWCGEYHENDGRLG